MELLGLIIVGFVVGSLMIALGGGGGAIYLGILSGLMQLPPATAAATSIITALPALILGAWKYYQRRMINFHLGNRMLISAIPSIIVGYLISPYLPTKIYKAVMGIILICLGIQLLYGLYHHSDRHHTRVSPGMASIFYGILGGLMVGIAGLSGGGAVTTGLLILGVSVAQTSATSSYVLTGMSIVGAICHFSGGQIDWHIAIGLIIGSLIGANFAPQIILWLTKQPKRALYVKLFLGLFIIVMGLRTAIG